MLPALRGAANLLGFASAAGPPLACLLACWLAGLAGCWRAGLPGCWPSWLAFWAGWLGQPAGYSSFQTPLLVISNATTRMGCTRTLTVKHIHFYYMCNHEDVVHAHIDGLRARRNPSSLQIA